MVEAAPNLVIVMNSEKVLEYFRQRSLSERQTDDLDRIDAKLEQGFQVGGDFIKQPSAEDKAMFMANMLIHALNQNDETKMGLCCSFLATRYPDLKQVRIVQHPDRTSIEMINDRAYVEEAKIQFKAKHDLS